MARLNRTLALTTGVWIRLSDLATAATAGEQLPPQCVVNLSLQMKAGGSGLAIGSVGLGIPNGTTPTGADGQLTAQLAACTATAPGGQFYINQTSYGSPLSGIADLTRAWISGTSGDSMIVSYDTTP